jgi:hypothetical protein
MKPIRSLLLVPLASFCGYASHLEASELLASFTHFNGGGSGPCEIAPVEFYLGIDGPAPLYYIPIGRGMASWSDGESGGYEMSPYNEPNWSEFSDSLTNGLDDHLFLLSEMHGAEGGGGPIWLESGLFPAGHDLAGNQLDFVRLDVSNVHIWTIDPTTQWQGWTANVTYEFWGTPLPEPATALLLICGSILLRRRSRSYRSR